MDRHESTLLLHADFDAQARRTPAAIALQFADRTITYQALAERSNRLAAALRQQGITQGSCVGLHVNRSIDYVTCVLAILKAGSAVLPLPPSYPRVRKHDILAFATLDAVIDDDLTPLEPAAGTRVLRLSTLERDGGHLPASTPANSFDLAFVLCSSGSTGKPKMIARSHRSFYHRLCWTWATHPYDAGERCVQKSTMTTTHAIYELFEPLLRGVPTLILDDPETRNLEQFWRTINEQGITRLLVVPSALQVSLEFPGFAVPAMKVVVLMGEYVHHRLAGRAIEAFSPHCRLYSIYGSTEASSTLLCDLKESYRPDQELPLGRPISADVQAYVLGADLAPVAAGGTGVLHFGGTALFSEYFRDPALTASVFIRSPGIEGPLYDTHDQVRLTTGGNLEYVGRTDHMVKVRGFRVDLQEVERTLLMHPEIHHGAIVLSAGGDAATVALLGFYAPASVNRASVQRFLQERLPAYMVPSALVGLESLPRTASGKTDRRRLLDDYASTPSPVALNETWESSTQDRIREVWQQVLAHSNVRAESGFFDAGGTSLSAFAAVHRLREVFGLDRAQLTDQAFYQFPTLKELAVFIDQLRAGEGSTARADSNACVQLRKGSDGSLPPLFLIASAGGTLGAYDKLVRTLRTPRDIIGIRDPYVLGERNPTMSFQQWVSLYIDAMRQRQPQGPYFIVAYSSAGAFGYEVARRFRQVGEDVALLALIDPFGLDRPSPRSFGYRVMRARSRKSPFRIAVRLEGWFRAKLARLRRADGVASPPFDLTVTQTEFARRVCDSKRSRADVLGFSALLELNTGAPFALTPAELSSADPDHYFPAFLARVKQVSPDLDSEIVDRIYSQYFGLQVPAQQRYALSLYDGEVQLIELDGPSSGLVSAQLRPHAARLRVTRIKVGRSDTLRPALVGTLSAGLRDHFLCMRNDQFVRQLAEVLEAKIG